MSRRRKILLVVGLLYVVTWIGGWRSHRYEISAEAHTRYQQAQDKNRASAQDASTAATDESTLIRLRDGGPVSGVDWCVPLLPGVLLANSHYIVGPLYGKGTTKLVVFYGLGSKTLWELWGWIA